MNESEKRDKWLKIRISEEEREVINKKFRNSGLKNLSDFVRTMIFVGVIVRFDEEKQCQLLRDFSSMSNNINQIARRVSRVINVLTQLNAESQKQLETAALLQHAR